MKVYIWYRKNQWEKLTRAYFLAEKIIKENQRSIRFELDNGEKKTVKKDDIITIEND